MGLRFEELDWQATPMGEVSLRRRRDPALGVDVYEVLLGDEYLMSSLFTVAEEALATLALAEVDGAGLDVVVGGLGLGWTARAVLADARVRSLEVVEAVGAVLSWHERSLLPHAAALTGDPRCRLVHDDFFTRVQDLPRCHAVLVDIDHSPRHLLDERHAAFYTPSGLRHVADALHAGGVFGLWSDDPPDGEFLDALRSVFVTAQAHTVAFANPYTGGESANTVYVARTPAVSPPG
jgi:spermidine synthase